MRAVPRLLAVLVAVLALAVLGVSVALAQELTEPAPEPAAPPAPPDVIAQPPPAPSPQEANGPPPETAEPVRWRASRAVGRPFAGSLVRGVELPAGGRDYFTWDGVLKRSPSRPWRRWGTDHLVRTLLRVLGEFRAAHPEAPRVGIGDLSRPRGGVFDERYGGLGHASHQNGLDVDIYYPRLDRAERRPFTPAQVDRALAQDLVTRFAGAGAQYVFVGPRLSLRGPKRIVSPLAHHDDHLHVRLRAPRP
jgi:murein endopeptidase